MAAGEKGSGATAAPPPRSEEAHHLARASKDRGRGPPSDRDGRLPAETAPGKHEPEKAETTKEDVAEPDHAPTQLTSSVQVVPTESHTARREAEPTPQLPTDQTGGPSGTQGSQPSHSFTDPGVGGSEAIGTQPGPAAAAPRGAERGGTVSTGTRRRGWWTSG